MDPLTPGIEPGYNQANSEMLPGIGGEVVLASSHVDTGPGSSRIFDLHRQKLPHTSLLVQFDKNMYSIE
jgi:hypothetical protein